MEELDVVEGGMTTRSVLTWCESALRVWRDSDAMVEVAGVDECDEWLESVEAVMMSVDARSDSTLVVQSLMVERHGRFERRVSGRGLYGMKRLPHHFPRAVWYSGVPFG